MSYHIEISRESFEGTGQIIGGGMASLFAYVTIDRAVDAAIISAIGAVISGLIGLVFTKLLQKTFKKKPLK